MHVRYTGSYPGALEGHALWQPGEVRDVPDDIAANLTRGAGAFWEQVDAPPATMDGTSPAPQDDDPLEQPSRSRRAKES